MIHVENLTRYYDQVCAVDRISLHIDRGQILGLLGPNGAGKTTALRMLTGFLTPTSGSIRIKGLSLKEDAVAVKNLLGYLPESAPIYPDMLVYDYLDYVAALRGIRGRNRPARIRDMAATCGLETVMHMPVAHLSKGFRQRVGLAHAMVHDPEILVLDEPTSGLDPNQIVEIRNIIRMVGREKTIIFSTHILSEAEATCDRIVIIDKGKIVADEPTAGLKQYQAGEDFIFLTLSGVPPEDALRRLGEIEEIIDVDPVSSVPAEATGPVRLKLRCRRVPQLREIIYQNIKTTDWMLLEFYCETPSLEHIFRELTRGN